MRKYRSPRDGIDLCDLLSIRWIGAWLLIAGVFRISPQSMRPVLLFSPVVRLVWEAKARQLSYRSVGLRELFPLADTKEKSDGELISGRNYVLSGIGKKGNWNSSLMSCQTNGQLEKTDPHWSVALSKWSIYAARGVSAYQRARTMEKIQIPFAKVSASAYERVSSNGNA